MQHYSQVLKPVRSAYPAHLINNCICVFCVRRLWKYHSIRWYSDESENARWNKARKTIDDASEKCAAKLCYATQVIVLIRQTSGNATIMLDSSLNHGVCRLNLGRNSRKSVISFVVDIFSYQQRNPQHAFASFRWEVSIVWLTLIAWTFICVTEWAHKTVCGSSCDKFDDDCDMNI